MADLLHAKRQWAILWPDGSVLSADTPGALLNRLALLQWEQPCTEAQLRARLVDRAKAWSGCIVREDLSDEDLLAALADAGMFALNTPWSLSTPGHDALSRKSSSATLGTMTTPTTAKDGK